MAKWYPFQVIITFGNFRGVRFSFAGSLEDAEKLKQAAIRQGHTDASVEKTDEPK